MLAKHALSQLSYGPVLRMVGLGRLERPTSPLSGVRSNHLSYRPVPVSDAASATRGRPAVRMMRKRNEDGALRLSRQWDPDRSLYPNDLRWRSVMLVAPIARGRSK